jgi:glycosyltransferase involved in cell wall biosynthesis
MKTALLIVDPDFTTVHVGVRRVIQFIEFELDRLGYMVQFATIIEGKLLGLESRNDIKTRSNSPGVKETKDEKPFWASGERRAIPRPSLNSTATDEIAWGPKLIDPRDFTISIVTNPWLLGKNCVYSLDFEFTFGLVLDVVPNLLALGELCFSKWVDPFIFASEHKNGIEYMTRKSKKILAISKSTKQDLVRIGLAREDKIEVFVPFSSFGSSNVSPPLSMGKNSLKLLLVNCLDHRKNMITAEETLRLGGEGTEIEVDVVGKERVSWDETNQFFSNIQASVSKVNWFRSSSDSNLVELIQNADLLFFPSLYEGLGLPILESQANGTPVLSGRHSSCGEFNLNPTLTLESLTPSSCVKEIKAFASENAQVHLSGQELADSQRSLLSSYLPLARALENLE